MTLLQVLTTQALCLIHPTNLNLKLFSIHWSLRILNFIQYNTDAIHCFTELLFIFSTYRLLVRTPSSNFSSPLPTPFYAASLPANNKTLLYVSSTTKPAFVITYCINFCHKKHALYPFETDTYKVPLITSSSSSAFAFFSPNPYIISFSWSDLFIAYSILLSRSLALHVTHTEIIQTSFKASTISFERFFASR